jgi:hypothetical protein
MNSEHEKAIDEMVGRLNAEWPVCSYMIDGRLVVCMETPVEDPPNAVGAVSYLVVAGFNRTGFPIAMLLPLTRLHDFSEAMVTEAINSPELLDQWDCNFGNVVNGLNFTEHSAATWTYRWFRHLVAWLLGPDYDVREYYCTTAIARHLLASDLPKVVSAFMMTRAGYFQWEHTATQWFEKFGPDPESSWVLGLVSRWPCFETAIVADARRQKPLMSRSAPDDENILNALRRWDQNRRRTPDLEPPPADRRRTGRLLAGISASGLSDMAETHRMLESCPADWWPASPEGWLAAKRAAGMAAKLQRVTGLPWEQVVRTAKGRWRDWCDIVVRGYPPFGHQRAADPDADIDLTLYAAFVEDVMRAFYNQVLFPCLVLLKGNELGRFWPSLSFSSLSLNRPATSVLLFGDAAAPRHRFSKISRLSITLTRGRGIEGDAHYGPLVRHRYLARRNPKAPNLRQVHLIPSELFDALQTSGFEVRPGDLGENIATVGLDLECLPLGTLLRLGASATLELTGLRTPCVLIDRFKSGLKNRLQGGPAGPRFKAGVMAIVTEGGEVSPGDRIRAVLPAPPHLDLPPL